MRAPTGPSGLCTTPTDRGCSFASRRAIRVRREARAVVSLAVTKTRSRRSPAYHLAFAIVFTALFVGGVILTFVAAPLFALTPLQWGFALVLTVAVGLSAAWELRSLVLARRSRRRRP